MNTFYDPQTLQLIRRAEEGNRRYCLLKLEFGQSRVYAVYAEHGEDCALELFGSDEICAERWFGQIAEGGLAPLHLSDFASDCKRKSEIFV